MSFHRDEWKRMVFDAKERRGAFSGQLCYSVRRTSIRIPAVTHRFA